MTISGIGNKIITYTLSGLGNNSNSVIPLAFKDMISAGAIVNTYRKEGTAHDVREKAIEEYGTGAVWAFGIPVLKKIIDKTVYPALGLNPDLDLRVLKDKDKLNKAIESLKNTSEPSLLKQKQILESLDNKSSLPFTNKQLYKGAFYGKFALATMLCAFGLYKIIEYKQKTTEEKIKKDYYNNNASRILLNDNIKNDNLFGRNKNSGKNISFTSLGSQLQDFMFNPVKNTLILDGVITTTRLKEARHGERKEVALKEIFQILFIYGVAKPLQKIFEFIGNKLNLPVETDAKVIFDKDIAEKLKNSKDKLSELKASKDLTKALYELDPKSSVADILDKNGTIKLIRDKNGIAQGVDRFSLINEANAKEGITHIQNLGKYIDNLKAIKAYKGLSVIGNVGIAVWAMGVLQPKLNIIMRKKINGGDNSNPAIKAQEELIAKNETLYNPLKIHQG